MNNVVVFNDKLPPNYGGMETHFMHAMNYFKNDANWTCKFVVSKHQDKEILLDSNLNVIMTFKNACDLGTYLSMILGKSKYCLLFNNGVWIEDLEILRKTNNNAIMCQRTGGNEFMKATLNDNNLPIKERQTKWAKYITQNLDFIISNSNYTNQRLLDIGVHQDKIVKIRGGVDKQYCEKNMANRIVNTKQFYEKFNLCSKKYIITVAARLINFKGIDIIIKAISKSKYKKDTLFVCIGDGELKNELYKLCEKHLESNSYVFTGSISHNETLEIISISHLYCSASREIMNKSNLGFYIHTETMGRSLLEAICQNIKVVATNVGGVNEWFNSGHDIGTLIDEDDNLGMTKAIDKILNVFPFKNHSMRDYVNEFSKQYQWGFVFETYKRLWENLCC